MVELIPPAAADLERCIAAAAAPAGSTMAAPGGGGTLIFGGLGASADAATAPPALTALEVSTLAKSG